MKLLIDNFDTLFDNVNSLEELKSLVLELAVRGKLVPQDPNDEPASVLLEKIKKEKERLIKEKKIKKEKPLPPIRGDEIPYELPDGWEWVRLGEISNKITDGTHETPEYTEHGIPFLSVKNISKGTIDFSDARLISKEAHEKLYKRCNPEYGDLLLTKVGTTGIAKVVDTYQEFSLFVSVALIKLNMDNIYPHYLENVINSNLAKEQSKNNTKGIGNKNLVLKHIKNFVIPLPPFNEQKRIVQKVDEIFDTIPFLQEALEFANKHNKQLNSNLLYYLTNADNRNEFKKNFNFILNNFNTLYNDIENVEELKQAILTLAVQGKLVLQDPNDEPVSVLLEKIKEEKEKLIKEKKIKKEKPLPPISEDEIPYKLPDGWEWVRLGDIIINVIGGGTPDKNNPAYWGGGIKWASVKDMVDGMYINSTIDSITYEGLEKSSTNLIPQGNIIICTRMGLGKININNIDLSINQDLKALLLSSFIKKTYFYYFYKSTPIQGTGMTVKGIKQKVLLSMLFPLPPLNEQKRIVQKINELITLCDGLKNNIDQSQKEHEALRQGVFHEFLLSI